MLWMPYALILLGAPQAPLDPGEPPPQPNHVTARSRIFMRLDPQATPSPDGDPAASTIGSFQVRSVGDVDVEASGWLAHAPGAAAYSDDGISGDVSTLLYREAFGPLRLTLGRQWTPIGGQRLEALDGITARAALGRHAQLALRAGQSGLEPRDAFGDTREAGGEARFSPIRGAWLGVGVLHQSPEDAPARTRWTLTGDYAHGHRWTASTAATMDLDAEALVDGRVELSARATERLWLRGYGRRVRVDLLLAADELLALFVEDVRDEAGLVIERFIGRAWRARVDGGWVRLRDHEGASRWRGGLEYQPRRGPRVGADGTLRISDLGYSTTGRLYTRSPLRGTAYVTGEALADASSRPGESTEVAGLLRMGVGFEPWEGWGARCGVEAARTPRWPYRVAGMVLLEHALGAPVRWGGTP